MNDPAIHHPPLMPHLLIDGLNRYNEEPCLFMGDKVCHLKIQPASSE
jgi:fatty-acyl-CoA synthase